MKNTSICSNDAGGNRLLGIFSKTIIMGTMVMLMIVMFGFNIVQAAYESDVFDEYLPVEYTDKIVWGDHYILLSKIDTGFSSGDYYYGLYDYVNEDWVIDYQLFPEGYVPGTEYAGDGMFMIPGKTGSDMSPFLLNGSTGEFVSLDGLKVDNLKFVDGIAVARAEEVNTATDIYVIYNDGFYYATGIMDIYENTSPVIHGSFYRDANTAVYIFSDSTFIIYNIEEEKITSFDRPDYAEKLTAYASEAELAVCGDYMVYLNMEGNDHNNYYAVTTLEGTDYIEATACDYAAVTENGNLLVVNGGAVEEVPLADKQLSEVQPIGKLALISCEKEDREEMLVNIDRKRNLYQNSIVYRDIFYLDNDPPYDIADTYYLGGKYSDFSGTWYFPDDTLEEGLSYVRLMGDGQVLYESTILDAQSCYENFSVDVTGISQLGIEYDGVYGSGNVAVGLANGEFTPAGAVDAAIEKNPLDDGEDGSIENKNTQTIPETVKLYDLHAYLGGLSKCAGITDNMGITYNKAIRAFDDEESATYDIGGKYSLLTGTVAVTKADQDNDYARNKRGYIRIYGDGNLLWEDADLNSATKPYEMSVDITGVTDLKVELSGFKVNYMWDCLTVIFDNVTLTV